MSHNDRVDFSKMTDKQFDKHMRESDKAEDEVRTAYAPELAACARIGCRQALYSRGMCCGCVQPRHVMRRCACDM